MMAEMRSNRRRGLIAMAVGCCIFAIFLLPGIAGDGYSVSVGTMFVVLPFFVGFEWLIYFLFSR
jgi:hypothetical protein